MRVRLTPPTHTVKIHNTYLRMLSNTSTLCVSGFANLPHVCRRPSTLEELEQRHRNHPYIAGNCAVVGASGSLTNSKMGVHIDAFETVIRVNRAPTRGWHRDVGSKTTLRIMSMDEFAHLPVYRSYNANMTFEKATQRRPREIVVVGCYGPFRGRCTPDRLLRNIHPNLNSYLLSPHVARSAMQRANVMQRSPPAGMVAVEFALQTCSNVTVFGFAHPSCPQSTCYHYYSRRCRMKESGMRHKSFSGGFHDFEAQITVLSALEAQKLIHRVAPNNCKRHS